MNDEKKSPSLWEEPDIKRPASRQCGERIEMTIMTDFAIVFCCILIRFSVFNLFVPQLL